MWWARLLEDDVTFVPKLQSRWAELRQGVFNSSQVSAQIDAYVETLGAAVDENFQKWNTLGSRLWPNPTPVPQSYAGEIANLKQWIQGRSEWLDGALDPLSGTTLDLGSGPTLVDDSAMNDYTYGSYDPR